MYRYDFSISDLLFRVEAPRQLAVPDNFRPFLIDDTTERDADILVEITFGTLPDAPFSERFHWQDGEYIIRQELGRQGHCRLGIPHSFADAFCERGNWLLYMAPERLLLPYDRLILHASAVIHQGRAYLFSAPSGGGKSTHAALWQTHFGAELLNGDKVVIHVEEGNCTAYGSPVAGSSGIYRNVSAPVAAIFLLHKQKYNKLSTVSKRNALLALYSEAIKCGSDGAFNMRLLDLLEKLQTSVPVFSLECLPEKGAVECILKNMEGMTQ